MKRREEIVTATLGCRQSYADLERPITPDDVADAFEKGAYWADKTMIEKARQWFNLHFRQVGTPREVKHDFQSKEKMWKSFTQFMEE